MPLLAFWGSNPEEVSQLSVEQILSNAGNGNLLNNSERSNELIPLEYTKLDRIIEVMFTTTRDVESAAEVEAGPIESTDQSESEQILERPYAIDAEAILLKRDQIISAVANRQEVRLVKRSRAMFWDSERIVRVVCTISKRYDAAEKYWYAYHPKWGSFLSEGSASFYVLGCLDLKVAFALPYDFFHAHFENAGAIIHH